jgi:hypothetical protein
MTNMLAVLLAAVLSAGATNLSPKADVAAPYGSATGDVTMSPYKLIFGTNEVYDGGTGCLCINGVGGTYNERICVDTDFNTNQIQLVSSTGATILDTGPFNLRLLDDLGIIFGSSNDSALYYDDDQTNHTVVFKLPATSNTILLIDPTGAAATTDYGGPSETNPTLRLQSSNYSDTAEYLKLSHNQTDGLVAVGQGDLLVTTDGADHKGAGTKMAHVSDTLTCDGGGSLTSTGLIPKYAISVTVTSRVTTGLTGPSTYDLGDGSDVDAYADDASASLGTTTGGIGDTKGPTAIISTPVLAAGNVVATFSPNCTAGAIKVVVHYGAPVAPTAN